MKHAFLIIAHNNWDQLAKLLSAYDSVNTDFFIHINSKIQLSCQVIDDLKNAVCFSKVYFTPRVPVFWGGVGILEASLVLLKSAFGSYDYYHLLTGSDLPLVSLNEFDAFFEENIYKNKSNNHLLTNYISCAIPNRKIASRVEHYNFFVSKWRHSNRFIRKMATASSTLLCIFQKLLGINRIKKTGEILFTGSSWWSVTQVFAEFVIEGSEKLINQYKKMTFAADEFAIQTLFMNSTFKDSQYIPKNNQNINLRHLDFARGNGYGSPHVYTIDDKDELENTENLIARKFDSKVDSAIVEHIINKIKSREDI